MAFQSPGQETEYSEVLCRLFS